MYDYDDLPDGHIRVAELWPGNFDDDIVVSLRPERFDPNEPPRYEALSYVWGTESSPNLVQIRPVGVSMRTTDIPDDRTQITHNLDVALRHLRYIDQPRFIWADAICIDQSNDIEKGPQVAKMGEIFRLAERVVVWLGPEGNNSRRAMDLMEEMGSQVEWDSDLVILSPSKEARNTSFANVMAMLPYEENDLTCLYHLLCRPWFERLWVRQEISLANDAATVMCGSNAVLWPTFRRGLVCL